MKKIGLLVVALAIVSFSTFAGEYFTNDTGHPVYGLHVAFSEPVKITAFGDSFTSVTPYGESNEFTFSGAKIEAWGGQWLNWEPASAVLVSHQWLSTQPEGGSQSPTDAASKIAYAYLTEPRHCRGKGLFNIPLYCSIPPSTPTSDSFSITISGMNDIELIRADEVTCVGEVAVTEIPIQLELQLKRNGVKIGTKQSIYLENGYQAITLAVSNMQGVSDVAPFPENFLRGATVTDVWGSYLYGTAGEQYVHTRNYFATTCDRLVEDGVHDVYVTTFLEYLSLLPRPKLGLQGPSGAGTISEDDMRLFATVAHDRGLRLHIRFDIFSNKIDTSYLYEPKSTGWLESFFDEYRPLILSQVGQAERCGVDAIVVGLGINYEGFESVWGARWKSVLHSLRNVFTGTIEYGLRDPDIRNYVQHRFPTDTFSDADAFLYGPWDPKFSSYDDSLAALRVGFQKWVRQFHLFANVVSKPLYLDGLLQSTDGYIVNGWHDVGIGKLGNTKPDFFEQARGYEALFEVLAATGTFDGVVLYKYHWADPFGPELPAPALARIDLSASVRNKPAEAIAKRWFGGEAGPQKPSVDEAALAAMRRPWCQIEWLTPSACEVGCATEIDYFDSQDLESPLGGTWSFDSDELHTPGSDPSSFCHLEWSNKGVSGGALRVESQCNSWMKFGLWGFQNFDAMPYSGIALTAWAETGTHVQLEILCCPSNGQFVGYVSPVLYLTTNPTRFVIPFAQLIAYEATDTGVGDDSLATLRSISFIVARGKSTILLDDLCFYKE